MKITQ